MSAPPFIQLYTGDYLADTFHLSTTEHGAYLLLIMMYWRRGEALPDDDHYLSSLVRMSLRSWKNIRGKLAQFFTIEEGYWFHKRIEEDLQLVRETSIKRSIAGQISARKRKAMAENSQTLSTDNVATSKKEAEKKQYVNNELDVVKPAVNNLGKKEAKKQNSLSTAALQAGNKKTTSVPISDNRYSDSLLKDKQDNVLSSNSFFDINGDCLESKTNHTQRDAIKSYALNTKGKQPAHAVCEAVDNFGKNMPETELPTWLPTALWSEFIVHRQSIKKPITTLSKKKIISTLKKFRDEGNDINAVLEASIMNGWTGVFPVKKDHSKQRHIEQVNRWENTGTAENNQLFHGETNGKF